MKAVAQKGRSRCWIFHFDITQNKKIEEESSKNEALYKNLSDHSPAIIYTKDMNGKYIHINKKAEEIFGVKNVEVVVTKPRYLVHFYSSFLNIHLWWHDDLWCRCLIA